MSSDKAMRHALQVTSAWLAALASASAIDETKRTVIRHTTSGAFIAELSISEALDLANNALEEEAEGIP